MPSPGRLPPEMNGGARDVPTGEKAAQWGGLNSYPPCALTEESVARILPAGGLPQGENVTKLEPGVGRVTGGRAPMRLEGRSVAYIEGGDRRPTAGDAGAPQPQGPQARFPGKRNAMMPTAP